MNIKESSERVISPHYPPIKFQFCLNGYGRTIDGQMTGTVHWVRFTLLSVKSGWQNPGGYGTATETAVVREMVVLDGILKMLTKYSWTRTHRQLERP